MQPSHKDLDALQIGPVRYGRSMLRRFGWFYYILGLGFWFRRIRFGDHSVEHVITAAKQGVPVYVLLHPSTMDYLVVNTVLNRRRLPIGVWSNGPSMFFWQPVIEAWRDLFSRIIARRRHGPPPAPVRSGWLSQTLSARDPVAIFLGNEDHEPSLTDDPLRAVLTTAASGVAISLLPVICVWDRAPDVHESPALTFLRGSRERPGLLSRIWRLFAPGTVPPFVQVGEPVDLAAFMTRVPESRQVANLRTLLRRYLRRESRVVRGPTLVPRHVMRELVLHAPQIRSIAAKTAKDEGVEIEVIEKRLDREFYRIAADFRFRAIRLLSIVMSPIWSRVYAGYDIPDEDLDKIRTAMRDGSAIIAPCHKSHFDYLLMSWILYWADLIVPHIIAGMNLALPGVNRILRASGAFFIERRFHGKPLHAAVFTRYLRELLLHGYIVEFFVEGGRTRTGRLLLPKLGVLEMVANIAHHAPEGHEITLLPVAISYEQVAEERAYQKEQGGAAKRGETLGDLVKARRVLMNRYGRIFVRVGDPLAFSDIIGQDWDSLTPECRHTRLALAGTQLMWRIGQAVVVLPTSLVSMALLSHPRSTIAFDTLRPRARHFADLLAHKGAILSPLAYTSSDDALLATLRRFERAGHIQRIDEQGPLSWRIVPTRRTAIEFHKNQVTHHLTAACLVSAAILAQESSEMPLNALIADFAKLHHMFQRELIYPPQATIESLARDGMQDLVFYGAIEVDEACVRVTHCERLLEVHGMVRALLETWRVVAVAATRWSTTPKDAASAAKAVFDAKGVLLAQGLATRPEAFGTVVIRHAIDQMLDDGVLTHSPMGITPRPERAEQLAAWLSPHIEPAAALKCLDGG